MELLIGWLVVMFLLSLFANRGKRVPPGQQPRRGPPLPSGREPARLPQGAPQARPQLRLPDGRVVVLEPAPASDPFSDWGAWPGEEESVPQPVAFEPEPQEEADFDELALVPEVRSLEVVESEGWHAGMVRQPESQPALALDRPVDRAVEHTRFHENYLGAEIGSELAGSERAARRDRTIDSLREARGLRRAVLLSEVLARPRSLREPDLP